MPRKKVEEKSAKETKSKDKKVKVKKEQVVEVIQPSEIKGQYSIRTVDSSGNIHFEINWDELKNHIQTALTTVEQPSKIVKSKTKKVKNES